MDKWAVYKKCDDFRVAAPKSVQDLVEIKAISENGIFEVGRGGIFTKTYKFSDINYATASVDEQIAILESWCRWLNSNSAPFKITFNNKNKNMATLREQILLHKKLDEYDVYRDYFNESIEKCITAGRQGIEQEMYITVRYDVSNSYENAKAYFTTLENSMITAFREIGSTLTPLDATERLRILHDFYRFGNEEYFQFNFKNAVAQGFDFKDAIINTRLDFSAETYFKTDNKVCSCLYLKQLPGKLTDRFIVELSKLPVKMIYTIDNSPISDKDVDDMLKSIYLGIEERIRKQNKTRVKQMDFSSDISLSVKMEKDTIETLIKEKQEQDQHFFYTQMNVCVVADNLEQLKKDCDLVIQTAKNLSCIFDYSYMKQKEALNTILPIGVRQVSNGRNLQTKSLAALFPFNVQELTMPGGMWYGTNLVSKNLCLANRKKLVNPHAFYFGETGSGKTTACQLEMMQVYLKTDDDIIVIDPKNDYEDVCAWLRGGYVNVSANSPSHYNPLEYFNDGSRSNIADEKAELVNSLVETCKREPLSAKESSIVNKALKYIYNEAALTGNMPTLTDLHAALSKIEEPEAVDLQWALDQFVHGSFNIFAQQSNVQVGGNRLFMFGLKDMGKNLRDVSMLVMLECVKERIMQNAKAGRATWLYIDEFHEVLHTDYSQQYIKSLWMLVRSLGGICTAMTQNVTDVLLNDTTKAMLDNSEFVLILKQQPGAAVKLEQELGLSKELIKYCTKESGCAKGLLRCGPVIIPASLMLEPGTELFGLFDKNFHRDADASERKPKFVAQQ